MASLTSGRRAERWLEALVAAGIVVALCSVDCAGQPHARSMPAWVFAGARLTPAPNQAHARLAMRTPKDGVSGRDESADFVVAALQETGLRFGTDGSPSALWGYMRETHRVIDPDRAARGDILFFNETGPGDPTKGMDGLQEGCADHVAIVSAVDADGRITFVDVRGGQKREGFVTASSPDTRRASDGRILNSFLRPKRPTDPVDARYFAGHMLCGVARRAP